MHWKLTTALICIYGVVKEFRPATPFLTPYLESDFKNFTNSELYSEVYPFWTYSYLVFLIPVFFLTDSLRYKPVVILESISLCSTWALLIWGNEIWQMQIMQICYGLATSSEIAYYSYMYAVVDKKYYKKITSYTRAAKMVGKFFAFSLAQILVSTKTGSYLLLNQISFAAVVTVFIISLILPTVAKPRLKTEVAEEAVEIQFFEADQSEIEEKPAQMGYWKEVKEKILIFKTNKTVLVWSFWWALASCGNYQMGNYAQTLWAELQTEGQFVGNGVVECFNTLLGALVTFYLQYLNVNWKKYGEVVFFVSSIIIGFSLFGMVQIRNIFVVYGFYIFSDGVYHLLIAAARSNSVSFGPDVRNAVFKSPGFPIHYCSNLRSVFEIDPKEGDAVALSIEFFDTEAIHDYVEIHQTFWYNDSFHNVKQHVLSGAMGHQPRHFTSSKNGGLMVVFVTDATENEFSGFQMSYHRFTPGENSKLSNCPFPFYWATNPTLKLPSVTKTFVHDTSCVIQINSTDAVKLSIDSLSTAVSIKFIETENFRSNRVLDVLESLNGYTTHKLPYVLQSRTKSLTLLISFSGELTEAEAYDIQYESAISVCTCLTSEIEVNSTVSKTYISPGYPLEYCDDLHCQTRVTALLDHSPPEPQAHQYNTVVQLFFNFFMVEIDVDFLQLVDKIPLLNLSDNAKGISYFTFDHRQVDLRFISDHSVVEKGFNISIIAYKKPYYCQCPDSPKVLAGQHYEQNHTFYENCGFMDCFWRIYPPSSEDLYRMVMKVNYKLQAESEFIEISNGENMERNPERIRLEFDAVPDEGDTAERFIEYDIGLPYVQIWYHRQGDNVVGDRIFNFEYDWRKRCQCGPAVLDANSEDWLQLTSPDYPTSYCNNLSCTWLIQAPLHHIIQVNITDFLTEIDQDFLGIFNGNDTNGTHIELLSGMEQFENLILSNGNTMSIMFTSDVSLSLRGFSLWYKAKPMNGYPGSGLIGKFPAWIFLFFCLILIVGGIFFYMIKTDKLDTSHIDFRTIRFINSTSRRTESEASLMNPVYRPTIH